MHYMPSGMLFLLWLISLWYLPSRLRSVLDHKPVSAMPNELQLVRLKL